MAKCVHEGIYCPIVERCDEVFLESLGGNVGYKYVKNSRCMTLRVFLSECIALGPQCFGYGTYRKLRIWFCFE